MKRLSKNKTKAGLREMAFGELGRWFLVLLALAVIVFCFIATNTEKDWAYLILICLVVFWFAFIYGYLEGKHDERYYWNEDDE